MFVAFVIDVFFHWIVGTRASSTHRTDLALGALERAVYDRERQALAGLIHQSDRGVQYLSIRYTEHLREAGIEPPVGSVGDSYDNAMAESVIGLFKTEVLGRPDRWGVHWFSHRGLPEPIGDAPPAKLETEHHRLQASAALAA